MPKYTEGQKAQVSGMPVLVVAVVRGPRHPRTKAWTYRYVVAGADGVERSLEAKEIFPAS